MAVQNIVSGFQISRTGVFFNQILPFQLFTYFAFTINKIGYLYGSVYIILTLGLRARGYVWRVSTSIQMSQPVVCLRSIDAAHSNHCVKNMRNRMSSCEALHNQIFLDKLVYRMRFLMSGFRCKGKPDDLNRFLQSVSTMRPPLTSRRTPCPTVTS